MNTLTALLALASHMMANSTPDGGLNELTNDCTSVVREYGDQQAKYATLASVMIFNVRRLPAV